MMNYQDHLSEKFRLMAPAFLSAVLASTVLSADTHDYIQVDPSAAKPVYNQYGMSEPALEGINIRSHDNTYKTETFSFRLDPKRQVEYMIDMFQGETLLYTWEGDASIFYDFHAHPAAGHPDFWSRYSEGNTSSDHGSIVAPYTGEHGWLWMNTGDKPVTIRLTVTGYYELVRILD